MHDHSPPSIGHWAMVRALLAVLLFNALALGIFIASYLAYARRPHPASFILCMVMPLLLLLLLALQNRQRRRLGLTWADIGFHQPQRSMWQLLWQIPAALLLLVLAYKACLLMIEPLPDDPIFKPLAPWWFFAVSAALLIPLTEEIAFRGLFSTICKRAAAIGDYWAGRHCYLLSAIWDPAFCRYCPITCSWVCSLV